jgi:hypothetical protein
MKTNLFLVFLIVQKRAELPFIDIFQSLPEDVTNQPWYKSSNELRFECKSRETYATFHTYLASGQVKK